MNTPKNFLILKYSLKCFLNRKLLNNNVPIVGGLVINEKCNLNCKQCKVSNRNNIPDLSFEEVVKGLQLIFMKGIRVLFIEGGEPFLWRDGKYKLSDVIKIARQIGFLWISIYTNGTLPIDIQVDTVFVSLDGPKQINNELRSNGRNSYDIVINNIISSKHPNIIINFTINNQNKETLKEFCNEIKNTANVKGIFFNFHTPYYGFDDLFINIDGKRKVIKNIFELKRRGYKILNSNTALKNVANDKWKRPSNICYLYSNNKVIQCCREFGNKLACKNCGYLMYPEIENILKLKFDSILSAFRFI